MSKSRKLISFSTAGASLIIASSVFAASEITGVGFKGNQDPSEIVITTDGKSKVSVDKQENAQDSQIVLELKNAHIAKQWTRKIDTSSFNSNVSLISPYQVEGQADTVRIVIQLRKPGSAQLTKNGNIIKVAIPTDEIMTSAADAADANEPPGGSSSSADSNSSAPDAAGNSGPTSSGNSGSSKTREIDKFNNSVQTFNNSLDEFSSNRETKRFTGRPITLNVRDVDVSDVFRLIAEASGFNIIVGEDVKGKITLSLNQVPWDQALDTILHTLRLGAERNNNILRIVTLESLTKEKQQELSAQQAAEASMPRITRIFSINYAKLDDLTALLKTFISSKANTTAGIPSALVQPDNRTNSIVVQDISKNVDKMKKLIEVLDTQTPQVLIEARVIEAEETFGSRLHGSFGLGNTASPNFQAIAAGGDPIGGSAASASNPVDALLGTPGIFGSGSAVSQTTATTSNLFGFSFLPGSFRINALISMGENEQQLRVVSAPKSVVLNKQKAHILQSTPVQVPTGSVLTAAGTQQNVATQPANLSLDVTPTVTNEGSVLLDLQVHRDIPSTAAGQAGVETRELTTNVLVDSGSTLVIGGIYVSSNQHTSSGIPFLRKIPLIGSLFGNDEKTEQKNELYIFVTPRILNPKEAGLDG